LQVPLGGQVPVGSSITVLPGTQTIKTGIFIEALKGSGIQVSKSFTLTGINNKDGCERFFPDNKMRSVLLVNG
jgi:hypothetical protein